MSFGHRICHSIQGVISQQTEGKMKTIVFQEVDMNTRWKRIIALIPILIALMLLLGLAGCQSEKTARKPEKSGREIALGQLKVTARDNLVRAKLGPLPSVAAPADNPITPEKVALGKMLFFDPRLSADGKTSCASCHQLEKAWADGRAKSVGVHRRKGLRNTPTLLNVAYHKVYCWDGRAKSLEEQVLKSLADPVEMGSSSARAVKTISAITGYRPLFQAAFGSDEVTTDRLAQAIASFERTLVTGPSPFDRFLDGDLTAMTPEQKEGLSLFLTRAECVKCHRGPTFSNDEFALSGIYVAPDWGRYNLTKRDYDLGKFRVPSLRNVALTRPYFHNGSESSLRGASFFRMHGKREKEVNAPGGQVYALGQRFSDDEVERVTAFLEALSGEPPHIQPPTALPQ
jgi:cytochrome c peroxidase